MKVTQIKQFPFTDEKGKLYYIVKIETDSGVYGLGEVGIPHWGGAIGKAIEHLSQVVVGQDPFSTEKMWQQMFRGGFFPADKVYSCAISGIDIALWDIKIKGVRNASIQAPWRARKRQSRMLSPYPRGHTY